MNSQSTTQSRRSISRAIVAVGLTATLTGGAVVVGTQPAFASTACSSDSSNPRLFVGTNEMVYRVALEGRWVKLVQDYQDGKTWGWATISSGGASTRATDRVWMDVTNRLDREKWDQCGPFTTGAFGDPGFTRAEPATSSASRAFRACGDVVMPNGSRKRTCGAWW